MHLYLSEFVFKQKSYNSNFVISLSCLLYQEDNSSEHGELETLREKIVTLTTSLATVMEQKSKMEASYQADKKKMMVCTSLSAGTYLRGLLI